jgi:hypothetical protein
VGEQVGERTENVDYCHTGERLSTVAEAVHGVQTPGTHAWAAQQRAVLQQGVDAVLEALHSPGGLSEPAQETLRRERAFSTTNRQRMQYPAFRAQRLPLGCGAIASSGKHLIQLRMKRSGYRRSVAGGQAMAHLSADRAAPVGQAA